MHVVAAATVHAAASVHAATTVHTLDQASSRILDDIVQKHAMAGGMVLAATHLDFAAAAKPRSLHLPGLVT